VRISDTSVQKNGHHEGGHDFASAGLLAWRSGSSNSLSFATMQVYVCVYGKITSFQAPDNMDNPIVIIGDGQEVSFMVAPGQ
jgi:hypothetical protein